MERRSIRLAYSPVWIPWYWNERTPNEASEKHLDRIEHPGKGMIQRELFPKRCTLKMISAIHHRNRDKKRLQNFPSTYEHVNQPSLI